MYESSGVKPFESQNVTLADVVAAVRVNAVEDPEFVYTSTADGSCFNWPTPDNPKGCIVGAAFTLLRVDQQWANRGRVSGLDARDLCYRANLYDSDDLDRETQGKLDWLDCVQKEQDAGMAWADAVANADRVVS